MLNDLWNCEKESYSECKHPVLQKIVDIIKYNYSGYDLHPTRAGFGDMGFIRRKLWEKKIERFDYDRPLLLRLVRRVRERNNSALEKMSYVAKPS